MSNWYNKNLAFCTDKSGAYPEEFWNCADITIVNEVSSNTKAPSTVPVTIAPSTYPVTKAPSTVPVTKAPTIITTDDDESNDCKSIRPEVTDAWCKAVQCDAAYIDFCRGETNPPTISNCVSISPQVTDAWCQSVKCHPVYKDFCSSVENAPSPQNTEQPTRKIKKIIVGYYTSWSIYARNFLLTDIDFTKITHLNYAFANFDTNGNMLLGDRWADTEFVYPDEVYPGTGNFGALQRIKSEYPNIKTLISIGGWTWSTNFASVTSKPETRTRFVESAIEFMLEYEFDGIDIDWEFPVEGGILPGTEADTVNLTLLLEELREKIDLLYGSYLITLATTQNVNQLGYLELSKIYSLVDFLNVMTYDYHGPWNKNIPTNHNAPLYQNPNDPTTTASIFNIQTTVENYQQFKFWKDKIVVGLPFYGYYYGGVDAKNNGLFQPWKTVPKGTWVDGILDYDDIRDNLLTTGDWEYHFDENSKVPYLYSRRRREFISFDDTTSISLKTSYVCEENFYGVMIWDLSSDKDADLLTVVQTVLESNM
jgi:chitinase